MRPYSRAVAATAAVGILLFVPRIGSAQHRDAAQRTAQRATTRATVKVQNDRSVPVTVYLDHGPFDVRLGVVPAMRSASLPLPSWLADEETDVQVFVHPEGGIDLASQHFTLQPGARLGVLVPARDEALAPPAPATMSAVIPPDELDATTITVENQRAVSVVMYVDQGDFDIRLGTVPANSSATLRIPEWLADRHESIEIFAHPERGADLASTHFELEKGAHLGLRVAAQ